MSNNQNINISNSSGVNIGSISNASSSEEKTHKTNTVSSSKDDLKELVGKNKFNKALDCIIEKYNTDGDVLDNAILLRSQFNHLRDEKIKGVLTDSLYITERNKLFTSLLALIESLE